MANKKIKLKNSTGDYLLPYTTNVPDATNSSKGLVEIEETPTAGSSKVLTSGGAKTALDGKLDATATAAKATADASGNVITTTYAQKSEVQEVKTTAEEAKSIAQGRARATAYADYNALVSALNQANPTEFKVGDNFFIQAQNVPDLWVYAVEATSSAYTYTDDETLVNALQTSGTIQVGYYTIAILESAKVDLSNFVPTSRTINGKALTTDITLTAADIGAMTSDDTAAKATADADGNNIATTYLKVTDAISFEEMD